MKRAWAGVALVVLLSLGLRGSPPRGPTPDAPRKTHAALMTPWLAGANRAFLVLDLRAIFAMLQNDEEDQKIIWPHWPDDLAYATLAVAKHRTDTHAWRVTLYCPTPQRALEIADTLGGIMTLFQMEPRALPLTTMWHSVTVRPQSTAVELEGIWTTSDLTFFTAWLTQEEPADAPISSH